MSKGVLILGSYNPAIDYVGMASLAAVLAEKHLNVRSHVHITTPAVKNGRHFRWADGQTEAVPWFNHNRADADLISPFDQTLLIDADYLVLTDQLKHVFDSNHDFLCHDAAWDVTQTNTLVNDQFIGKSGLAMRWATVMYFKKSAFTTSVFEAMRMVRDNYPYYAGLYGFKTAPYRNDYALTIAHQLQSGFTRNNVFPWRLPSLGTEDVISDVRPGTLVIDYKDRDKYSRLRLKNSDLHCMNKHCLMDEETRTKLMNVYS